MSDVPTLPQDPEAARELGRACGVGPAVAQVLIQRGLAEVEAARAFLAPRLSALTPPEAMADRALAADRIARAVQAKERIVVFGDFDVDGTTSAALLADVIEALGGEVIVEIANRFDGGYGLSDPALARCLAHRPGLLMTCDCGSSDHSRVAQAMDGGTDVIVVDHHLVPDEPLPALAFLNPHRPDCGFAYKGMSSAGLAMSVAAAVRKALGVKLDLRPWMDLVALGTIADVAPLDGDNRAMVQAGLRRLADPDARPGVLALRQAASVTGSMSAVDVSFKLAPRLNAPGRLGDASLTVDLLRARSRQAAQQIASRIERINQERRAIERRVTEQAERQVREVYGDAPEGGIVVFAEGWHRGVVGITAARLVDRFGVPAVVIGVEGGMGHGSARTPPGVALYDAVARHAQDLERFGGHHAAAGLSIREERLEALRAGFGDSCRAVSPEGPTAPERVADVRLDGHTMPVPTARDLVQFEPVGEANPEPLYLIDGARVDGADVVGDGKHLKLRLRVGPTTLRAFGFDMGHLAGSVGDTIRLLGHVRLETWRGSGVEIRLLDIM